LVEEMSEIAGQIGREIIDPFPCQIWHLQGCYLK
jgi:hypothetical protein